MDSIFIRVLVEELSRELNHRWVVGVYQPKVGAILAARVKTLHKLPLQRSAPTFILQLSPTPRKTDGDRGLYISLESNYPCIYLCPPTEEIKRATGQISIIKALKKYLHKAMLTVVQPGEGPSEVMITFEHSLPPEVGVRRAVPLQLILCLAKGHPHIRLVIGEGQEILAQYGEARPAGAALKPAHPHIFDLPHPEALTALLHPWEEGDLMEKLIERTRGLGRLWARELYLRAESEGYRIDNKEVTPKRLFRSIRELDYTLGGPPQPRVIEKPLGAEKKSLLALTPVPMIQFPLEWQKKFPTLSRTAQYYYEIKIEEENQRKIREEILKMLRREEKRLQKLKLALQADQAKGEAARDFKLYGELINAQVKTKDAGQRGQELITLSNYYQPDGPPLQIPLDPTLSLRQNAQRYFRLYQKAQRGQKIIAGRLNKAETELKQVQTLIEKVERAQELRELVELQEMLAQKGFGRGTLQRAPTKGHHFSPARSFHRFTSSQGYEILVGKNARENDRLTFTQAAAQDLWLHAQGFGGAHVVIRLSSPKAEVPDKTLEEAAQLAAYFSKARGKGKIKVLYAKAKEVKKPKGAKAGLVTVGRYRTIIIDTDNINGKILGPEKTPVKS